MIISKRNTSNIYDGCLAYLKNDLTAELPEGQSLINNGLEGLVGSETQYNVHNNPYDKPPSYFEIYFGDKYIVPTAYSLMGRREPSVKDHYLKSWNFSGKDERGNWILLHKEKDNPFSFAEIRTFRLKQHKSFNAFKIEMTDTDSKGMWALCLGQIDVFGDIYSKPVLFFRYCQCTKQRSLNHLYLLFCFIVQIAT